MPLTSQDGTNVQYKMHFPSMSFSSHLCMHFLPFSSICAFMSFHFPYMSFPSFHSCIHFLPCSFHFCIHVVFYVSVISFHFCAHVLPCSFHDCMHFLSVSFHGCIHFLSCSCHFCIQVFLFSFHVRFFSESFPGVSSSVKYRDIISAWWFWNMNFPGESMVNNG